MTKQKPAFFKTPVCQQSVRDIPWNVPLFFIYGNAVINHGWLTFGSLFSA